MIEESKPTIGMGTNDFDMLWYKRSMWLVFKRIIRVIFCADKIRIWILRHGKYKKYNKRFNN